MTGTPHRSRLPLVIMGLISAWILTGALFKLLLGTPADLPASVRELPLDLGLTYNLAISVELAVALSALLWPRVGWIGQGLLLLAFDAVLMPMVTSGDASCGCFGSRVTIPPAVMLAIDSTLFVALLLTRPWSSLGTLRAPHAALATALALALVLPWILDRQVGPGEVTADGQPVKGAWLDLDIEKWVGRDVWDTPLGEPPFSAVLDVLPLDGLWVFWRADCEHCAAHLKHLKESEHGERLIGLVRLEAPTDTEANRMVHELPDGNFVAQATLPPSFTYVLTTPGELILEAGRISAARQAVTPETGL